MEVSSGINEVDGMNGYTEQGTKVKVNQMHKETLFSLWYVRACPNTQTCGGVKVAYLQDSLKCHSRTIVSPCVNVCSRVWDTRRPGQAEGEAGVGGGEEALARFGSVLLQDQVFQLVRRTEQEGCRLSVARDELPHRRHLRGAELGRGPAPAASLTVTVGGGRGGGVCADRLHAQIGGTCQVDQEEEESALVGAGTSWEHHPYTEARWWQRHAGGIDRDWETGQS